MTRYKTAMALIGAIALGACSLEKNTIQEISGPVSGANVRFINLAVNGPKLNFYANDAKVTGTSSSTGAEDTTGTAYGSVAGGSFYNDITVGSVTFVAKITQALNRGTSIATTTANVETGKYYSVYTSGIYDSTAKHSDAFVVEDPLPAVDYSTAYVRFVNASGNAAVLTLYAKNRTTSAEAAVGGAVAYKAAGAFTAIPPEAYDLSLRAAGSNTNVVSLTNVSLAGGRVYTISLRGDMTVTSTTAANRPILQNNANR